MISVVFIYIFSFLFSIVKYDCHDYINNYKELAQLEMNRSGIPASIILSQAIVESNVGTSELAKKANNHFGIKCKSYWKGKTYSHIDDDKDENGNLISVCFRAYYSIVDSYIDHTNFLLTSSNYKKCFHYSSKDYEKWAICLKEAGYATNPSYSYLLIDVVNKYKLYKLDK